MESMKSVSCRKKMRLEVQGSRPNSASDYTILDEILLPWCFYTIKQSLTPIVQSIHTIIYKYTCYWVVCRIKMM